MKKIRIEIKVSASETDYASHVINWYAALREQFENKGNGVWHSTGEYQSVVDSKAAEYLSKSTKNELTRHGIRSFFIYIVEHEEG